MPVDRVEKCRSNAAKLQARSPVFSSPSLSDSLHFGSLTRWTFADTALAVVASLVTFWSICKDFLIAITAEDWLYRCFIK
jgi:divalent metal cation (Fe/Co/Zn/Cd) transporter